jgi:large subunit ribosomal protein L22e
MDLGSFEKFLHDHIKVNGKAGELGSKVTITKEKTKLIVSAELPFSKRYLKYLSKRFLQKQQLRNYLRVIAKDKSSYVLKYMPNSGISPADDDE